MKLSCTKGMEKLNADFNKIEKLFLDSYNENLNNEELVKLYNEIGDAVLKVGYNTLNDIYSFVFTGLLKRKLKSLENQTMRKKPNNYISGITNIESMKPVRRWCF